MEKLEEGAEEAMGLSGRGGEEKGAVVAVYELYVSVRGGPSSTRVSALRN